MSSSFAELAECVRAGARPTSWPDLPPGTPPTDGAPYRREVLVDEPTLEVMRATWTPSARCAIHDHGGASGAVIVLRGEVVETHHRYDAVHGLVDVGRSVHRAGDVLRVAAGDLHAMEAVGAVETLHVYTPRTGAVHVVDARAGEVVTLPPGRAAAWPDREEDLPREPLGAAASRRAREVVLVVHTTHYREGSEAFARAAQTLASRIARDEPTLEVRSLAAFGKRDLVDALHALADDGRVLRALHFVGHSGMYGPMFGTTEWPEQLSPHEWRTLRIPFAAQATATFHACRTARWFAPFFARTFGVEARGYVGYTTVSRHPRRYRYDHPLGRARADLHVIACVGRKSHGLLGAVRKHLGAPAEPLRRCPPTPTAGASSYDGVAALYDEAFADLRVRGPEVAFVRDALARQAARVARPLRVVDLGCGNGALFDVVLPFVDAYVGLDVSSGMLARAEARAGTDPRRRFERLTGPSLPLEDASVDVVVSFLSFRYLDWDPVTAEIARVLRPDGRLLVVDMVALPAGVKDLGALAREAVRRLHTRRDGRFRAALARLVQDPRFVAMVEQNPIRADHELRWYLGSRWPEGRFEVLSVGATSRVLGFDAGPRTSHREARMSFP